MLKVTVEIYPFGSKEDRKTLGELNIANTGMTKGNQHIYEVWSRPEESKPLAIVYHERGRGMWVLVSKAINAHRKGTKNA